MTAEINCRLDEYRHPSDPIFTRNHAPNRVVLGIIAKDGVMAQCALLHFENPRSLNSRWRLLHGSTMLSRPRSWPLCDQTNLGGT